MTNINKQIDNSKNIKIIINDKHPKKHRCTVCNGKGKVRDIEDKSVHLLGDYITPPWKSCSACDGTGER